MGASDANMKDKVDLPASEKKAKDAKGDDVPEMSEEDAKLQEEMLLLAQRAKDVEVGIQTTALNSIIDRIKESIGTMTTIHKPLKFLRPECEGLVTYYESMTHAANKVLLADILSVLVMTVAEPEECKSLKYRLEGSSGVGQWGHDYIRNLCGEVVTEWQNMAEGGTSSEYLKPLILDLVKHFVEHNTESDAIDLLLETGLLEEVIGEFVTDSNCPRITMYLLSCSSYLTPDDATEVKQVCVRLMRDQGLLTDALRVAMMINDRDLAQQIFDSATNGITKKQMSLMLGAQQMYVNTEDDTLITFMNNEHLSEHFLSLARELDVLEPKLPHQIFKISADDGSRQVDSARMNLAATLANSFVNAGYGNDKLMLDDNLGATGNSQWVFKNKDHGMLSAVASVGMIKMWDVDSGLASIDQYMYTDNNSITAGAMLACGIVNASVRNECDPALALLGTRVEDKSDDVRCCAVLGLGIAYAGSHREDVLELLMPTLCDISTHSPETCAMTCLSLGLVYCGSANPDVAESLLQALMELGPQKLTHPLVRFHCLALGLLFLGQGESAQVILEACKALDESVSELCVVIVMMCAYAASGDVVIIQKLLEIAGRHPTPPTPESADNSGDQTDSKEGDSAADTNDKGKEEDDSVFSSVVGAAVIGLGVVAMGEDIGSQMATRMTNHLIQFGDKAAKRGVPLCLAMLSTSNAEYRVEVTESLHKLSHDPDHETSMSAILGLGLVGAGTNNSRIADTLSTLAVYHEREPNHVFIVRLAQGLLHMGKGLITVSPFHSDRGLLRPTSLAGLLVVALSGLDFKNIILQKFQYLMFTLSLAMQPRMLVCMDEELNPLTVQVRVGQAVDIVGVAGKPKSITAFQTHTTPVLIHSTERAELATDEYKAMTSVLEGFVLLEKNPDSDKHADTSTK